jgi:transposase-like protein
MINLYKKGKAMRNKKNKSEEELALEACTKMLITNFNLKNQEDVYGKKGVLTMLQKQIFEAMLEGELDSHLGYEKQETSPDDNYRNGYTSKTVKTSVGEIDLDIPRDRNAEFEPLLVKKHQRRLNIIDDVVVSLYTKGLSLSQISEQIEEIYHVELSQEQISNITDKVSEQVTAWQNRQLDECYPIVYMDGIYMNVLEGKSIIKKVVNIAVGVNIQGKKEVLGLWISQVESAKYWQSILNEMFNRGIKQVCIFCTDGLTGIENAIQAVYPKAVNQQCIVHAIRKSMSYVSYKDLKEFTADLKKIYTANTIDTAKLALDELHQKWHKLYPAGVNLWYNRWENLTHFFAFPEYIRKAIYTTNAIESINSSIRKIIKSKKSFPNDLAVYKMLYLLLMNCSKKWTMPIRDWQLALNQFSIFFDLDLNNINN